MVSAIDATKPQDGVNPLKSDFRANALAAKNEIEALQEEVVQLLSALQLASGSALFPIIAGTNFPAVAANLITILQSLDAAIVEAAAGAGGGPITLASITDILSPTDAQRVAWRVPVDAGTFDTSFAFSQGSHANRWLTLDTTTNPVDLTLPAIASITQPDGLLCRLVVTSGSNSASIIGPTNTLRYQSGRVGDNPTQTRVFAGLNQSSAISSIISIYKEGTVYRIVGPCRLLDGDDVRFNAAGSVLGSALEPGGLLAATFPVLLDLGGTNQAGGARDIMQDIAGNHTFVQANAGKTLVHSGLGAATWTVPALLTSTTIDIVNPGGAIAFSVQGGQTTSGALNLPAQSDGAVRWLPDGTVRFVGTV